MENSRSRWSGVRSGLCCASVCLAAACASHAAPLTGTIDSVDAGNGNPCNEPREGCSAPTTFSADVLAQPEVWATARTAQFVSSLWPNRDIVTPDSPREMVKFLLGAGVRDIRLDSQLVFTLGAPRMDLAPVGLASGDASPSANSPSPLVRSALESKTDDGSSRPVPAESSVRLRELIESMAEANPIAQKNPKTEPQTPEFDEEALRPDSGRPKPDPDAPQHARGPKQEGAWTEAMKSVTQTVISFVRAVREFVTPDSKP